VIGDYQTALTDCNEAVSLKSSYELGHLCLGYVYEALGEDDKALSEYTLTLNLDPGNKWALTYRGEIYFYKEQYQQSIDDLSQAIEQDPTWDEPYIYRGYTYLAMRDYQRAIDDFNTTLTLTTYAPYKAAAYSRLGVSYFYTKEYQKAVDSFTLAIETSPSGDIAVYYDIALRAITYDEMGDYENALKDYIKFLDLVPGDNESTRYACARANVLAVLSSQNFLTFFLNLMIQPCTRFDVAGQTYGTDIPYGDGTCINSVYAPSAQMCDEAWQFLMSQYP
jgi:tetratricopeptide (TPR) repeat protein